MGTATAIDYGFLRQLVYGHSQNLLDPSREYLFDTRLCRLLRNQGMNSLNELIQDLKQRRNPALERAVGRGDDHQRNQLLPRQSPV